MSNTKNKEPNPGAEKLKAEAKILKGVFGAIDLFRNLDPTWKAFFREKLKEVDQPPAPAPEQEQASE